MKLTKFKVGDLTYQINYPTELYYIEKIINDKYYFRFLVSSQHWYFVANRLSRHILDFDDDNILYTDFFRDEE